MFATSALEFDLVREPLIGCGSVLAQAPQDRRHAIVRTQSHTRDIVVVSRPFSLGAGRALVDLSHGLLVDTHGVQQVVIDTVCPAGHQIGDGQDRLEADELRRVLAWRDSRHFAQIEILAESSILAIIEAGDFWRRVIDLHDLSILVGQSLRLLQSLLLGGYRRE